MNLTIRQESSTDHKTVQSIIEAAFANEAMSDQTEHLLVARLRKSDAFIPELSLVAEVDGQIGGHIILTKIIIKEGAVEHPSLALAPVSVHPDFQKNGIGEKLIVESHRIAKSLDYQSIVLLGHAHYYPRFGYELTSKYNIRLPFEAPEECCMVIALQTDGLVGVSGKVVYSEAFFG